MYQKGYKLKDQQNMHFSEDFLWQDSGETWYLLQVKLCSISFHILPLSWVSLSSWCCCVCGRTWIIKSAKNHNDTTITLSWWSYHFLQEKQCVHERKRSSYSITASEYLKGTFVSTHVRIKKDLRIFSSFLEKKLELVLWFMWKYKRTWVCVCHHNTHNRVHSTYTLKNIAHKQVYLS